MTLILACPHHDPEGRLDAQAARALPTLLELCDGLALHVTDATPERSLGPLRAAGAQIGFGPVGGHLRLGFARRGTLAVALAAGADTILFCDFDRALHWAEYHPAELAATIRQLTAAEFTVIGRTAAAFASHPATQRDTERVVNDVFRRVSGRPWDITAAARGLSAAAARSILDGCPDETVGTDASWPLHLIRSGFTLGYVMTEGMEFETPDRFPAEVAAAGGRAAWTARLDDDVRTWVLRLDIARVEVEAMLGG